MNLLLVVLAAHAYSPADSSWNMVTLAAIPERAILFAELAARDGGRPVVDLGALLELSGKFERAASVYGIALNSAADPLLETWLRGRIMGCGSIDTILVLSAVVTNRSGRPAMDVLIEIPLPVSHPPYQIVEEVAGVFVRGTGTMSCRVSEIPAGSTVVLPLLLHIVQEPHTYRPLQWGAASASGSNGLPRLAAVIRSLEIPLPDGGKGPCLELAFALKEAAAADGLRLYVTGGLLRTPGDTLLFHAWNLLEHNGMPMDVTLFHADSLRGIAHCPTDMIPLWNLEDTGGHEVSAFYSQADVDLAVSMTASFADPVITDFLFRLFPFMLLR